MKAKTNNIHVIFLLKKNIRSSIILEYLPIVAPTLLKEWKTTITLVRQEYKSTEDKQDY